MAGIAIKGAIGPQIGRMGWMKLSERKTKARTASPIIKYFNSFFVIESAFRMLAITVPAVIRTSASSDSKTTPMITSRIGFALSIPNGFDAINSGSFTGPGVTIIPNTPMVIAPTANF